jgi:transcriptional repressor NrdR
LVKVVKRDGKMEEFDIKKVRRSIEKAVLDANLILDEKKSTIGKMVKTVVDTAVKNGKIESKAIRKMIIEDFDRVDSSITRSWMNFEKKYKSM